MGYESIDFNANLFALPGFNFGNGYAAFIPVYPPSLFNFQTSQPTEPYNYFGLYLNNNHFTDIYTTYSNNSNFNLYNNCNLLNNCQININNTINPYFNNLFTPSTNIFANNIFSKIPSNLTPIKDEANNDKRNSTDGLGAAVAKKASGYIDKVNSDAEGNRLFSNGKSQAWCQDFVSSVLGSVTNKLPKIMTTTSSPIVFRNKANEMGCYYKVPSGNKNEWAKKHIHKGDVIIKSGKGQSGLHVAFVLDIKDDGTIIAVSGNSSDAVRKSRYNINKGDIYGIVDIEKLASVS